MIPEIKEALGKLVLAVVAQDPTAALSSTITVVAWIEPKRRTRVVRRAVSLASDQIDEWQLSDGISDADIVEGIEAAKEAIETLTAAAYAEEAWKLGRNPELIAQAIVGRTGLRPGIAPNVATHVLAVSIEALLHLPDFVKQFDSAVQWAAYRAVRELQQSAVNSSQDEADLACARAELLKQAIDRHSKMRTVDLSRSHLNRALYGTAGRSLSSRVRSAEAWRTQIDQARRELGHALDSTNPRSRTSRLVDQIDIRGSYDSVHAQLQASDAFRLSPEHARLSGSGKAALAHLRGEIDEPRYGTVLLLTGRWGAGKSRTLAEIASSAIRHQSAQLLLRPLPGASRLLDEAVLDEAQLATGRTYASMVELRDSLKDVNVQALIVVDDFERFLPTRDELDRLTQMMVDQTSDDRLRWVLTVDSWRLDRVLSPASTPRWERLSSSLGVSRTVSSWIDLDAAELGQRVGEHLVYRELGAKPATVQALSELLEVPLNAWLFIDSSLRGKNPPCGEDFDERYWDEVLHQLTWTVEEQRAFVGARRALQQLFIENSGRPVPRSDLYERANGLSREMLDGAIDVLGDARLVEVTPDDHISVDSAPLWASSFARAGLVSGVPTSKAALQELVSLVEPLPGELGEAVTMQILLQASTASDRLPALVRAFAQSGSIPTAGLWVAAINSLEVRRVVLAELREANAERDVDSLSAHAIYLLLRLLEIADDDFSFASRLRLLQPNYMAIGENGLHTILRELIGRLAITDAASESARTQLLLNADGIHRARSGKQFAERWVSVAPHDVAAHQLVAEVDRFVRDVARYTIDEIAESEVRDAGRPESAPLAIHIIDAILPKVVRDAGAEYAYDLLAARGWLDEADLRDGLGGLVRRQCHVALGKSYEDDPLAVVKLLEELLRGSSEKLESATFILRHTGPTFGRSGVHVPEELNHFAIRLSKSRRLNQSFKTRWVKPILSPAGG